MKWLSSSPVVLIVIACAVLAGCAAPSKSPAGYRVQVESKPASGVQIVSASARAESYGLVVSGAIHLAPNLPASSVHSVDIVVTGPDGKEIRKMTSQYYPTPKPGKKKPQKAHFAVVMYTAPPPGSVINVSLTPEIRLAEPVPENP